MSATRTPIAELDRQSALSCCEHALRNVSPAAARDVDFHAMAQSFADHGAAVIAGVQAQPASASARFYPVDLTPALAEVLGQPNYLMHPVWMALREVGISIKPRYEDELAAALHFLIPFALLHGDDWQRHAADRLLELRAENQARQAAG